jgi:hypothetical protein
LADGRAYAVFQEGRVVSIDVGQPAVPPMAVISVDRDGLPTLLGALTGLSQPEMGDTAAARAVLQQIVQLRLSDDLRVAAALKKSAEQHQAWFWFDDPALLALVTRRGWVHP